MEFKMWQLSFCYFLLHLPACLTCLRITHRGLTIHVIDFPSDLLLPLKFGSIGNSQLFNNQPDCALYLFHKLKRSRIVYPYLGSNMNKGSHKLSLDLPSRCSDTAKDVINALDSTPMSARLNSILHQREPGTNSEQLKDEKITAWIKGSTYQHWEIPEQEQPVSQIKKLFLYGFSGCGRTTLTASVIEHLISTECTEKQGVCYYFCNRFHQGTEDPQNVLKTFISQLGRQNESAFDVLNDHLNTRMVPPESINSHSYSLEDLGTLLGSMIRRFERVFTIINSVEVLLPGNATRLLSLMAGLSDSSETKVSLLSTGSEQPGQRELSQALSFCPVYVQGRPDDMRVYVRAELNRRVQQGDSELEQNHFQIAIENYIAERSNGA